MDLVVLVAAAVAGQFSLAGCRSLSNNNNKMERVTHYWGRRMKTHARCWHMIMGLEGSRMLRDGRSVYSGHGEVDVLVDRRWHFTVKRKVRNGNQWTRGAIYE
jgi:hypothetical protein